MVDVRAVPDFGSRSGRKPAIFTHPAPARKWPDLQNGAYNYCYVPYLTYFRKTDVKLPNLLALNLLWKMLLSWVGDSGHINCAIFVVDYCMP
jgi:hypothetical protein